jgi:hypothetical protein
VGSSSGRMSTSPQDKKSQRSGGGHDAQAQEHQDVKPEDHRRPKKKKREYPLSSYPGREVVKILAQENRIKTASLVSSVASQVALYPMDAIKTRMQVYKF